LEHDLFVFIEMTAFLVISSFPSKEALISLLEIVLFMQKILPLRLLEIMSYVTQTDGVGNSFFLYVNSYYDPNSLQSFVSSFVT